MYRSYKIIIEPVIKQIKPKHIVEIGAKDGANTVFLQQLSLRNDIKLSVIDPMPNFDTDFFKNENSNFCFYKDISLNILKEIKDADVILIDGDHNYYTVYNELIQIEKSNKNFPVIFLHDVSWPYDRRDMYYDPEIIPEFGKNPYSKKGIHPESVNLQDGGFNSHLYNAQKSNTPRNGVLTAVEDFISDSDLNLYFEKIEYCNGIGMICLNDKKEVINEFERAINSKKLTANLEKDKNIINSSYANYRVSTEKKINALNEKVEEKNNFILDLTKKINNSEKEIADYKDALNKRDNDFNLLKDQKSLLEKELVFKNRELEVIKEKNEHLEKELEVIKEKNEHLEKELEVRKEKNFEIKNTLSLIQKNKEELAQCITKLTDEKSSIEKKLSKIINKYNVASLVLSRLNTLTVENKKSVVKTLIYEYTRFTNELQDESFLNKKHNNIPNIISRYLKYFKIILSGGVKNAVKLKSNIDMLEKSDLFDVDKYLLNNPDVYYSGINPYLHYLYYGGFEDRVCSDMFDAVTYFSLNDDVKKSGMNPLIHYLRYGEKEGRVNLDLIRMQDTTLYSKDVYMKAEHDLFESNLVDVIVCVHNALEDVKECLNSLINNATLQYNLIIVNDGSSEETTHYLERFVKKYNCQYIHNVKAKGYTYAANSGLRGCKNKYAILLNSDTIVTVGWIEKMLSVYECYPNTGIVGPLSNAASFQTVPEIMENGDWKVNEIPHDWQLDFYSNLIEQCSKKIYPKVTFINGFCFMVSRDVIDEIGYLDEEIFGTGYGEENDFCIRAQEAGFELRVADNCYIFHEKSKSFTHETRQILAKGASSKLRNKHGSDIVSKMINLIKTNEELNEIRQNIISYTELIRKNDAILDKKIAYYLPVQNAGGGANSVMQEASFLRKMGLDVSVINKKSYMGLFLKNYPLAAKFICTIDNIYDLPKVARPFDVIIGTTSRSALELERVRIIFPNKSFLYYVQDYEPYFYEKDSQDYLDAKRSYECFKDHEMFAKTKWIRNEVKKHHKKNISSVIASLNASLYNSYSISDKDIVNELVISTMIRPSTPRRNPEKTVQALNRLSSFIKIKILLFGCNNIDLKQYDIKFEYESFGVLPGHKVPHVLKKSRFFLDYSTFQAFGRSGLEAMALGSVPILPCNCGTDEYAIDGQNCLLIDTYEDINVNCQKILEFIHREDYSKIRKNAIETSKKYNITNSSWSIYSVINAVHLERNKNDVLVLTNGRDTTGYNGSSYIRLIIPISSLAVKYNKTIKALGAKEFDYDEAIEEIEKSNLIVIQRNFDIGIDNAKKLIKNIKDLGKSYIYEIDDDLLLLDEYKGNCDLYISNAERIIVSTQNLSKKYNQLYNKPICVIKNTVKAELYNYLSKKKPKEKNKIIIGFFGTKSHLIHLNSLEEDLKKLKKRFINEKNIDLVFEVVGIADQGTDWYNSMKIKNIESIYPIFTVRLREIVERWSLGICYLAKGDFNNAKSYLKFLEYTAMDTITCASDVIPYNKIIEDGKNGYLIKDGTWENRLWEILNSKKQIQVLDNAKQTCDNLRRMEEEWLKILNWDKQ